MTVDQDAIKPSVTEEDLVKVVTGLAKLATGLERDTALAENELRAKFINVERSMFAPRLEKARVLEGYKALYVPLRKWSAFLRVIGMPRRTAEDYIFMLKCTKSVQKPKRQQIYNTFDGVVERAVIYVGRALKHLSDADKERAAAQVVEHIKRMYIPMAPKKPTFDPSGAGLFVVPTNNYVQ